MPGHFNIAGVIHPSSKSRVLDLIMWLWIRYPVIQIQHFLLLPSRCPYTMSEVCGGPVLLPYERRHSTGVRRTYHMLYCVQYLVQWNVAMPLNSRWLWLKIQSNSWMLLYLRLSVPCTRVLCKNNECSVHGPTVILSLVYRSTPRVAPMYVNTLSGRFHCKGNDSYGHIRRRGWFKSF